jgi:hypothetical protein
MNECSSSAHFRATLGPPLHMSNHARFAFALKLFHPGEQISKAGEYLDVQCQVVPLLGSDCPARMGADREEIYKSC